MLITLHLYGIKDHFSVGCFVGKILIFTVHIYIKVSSRRQFYRFVHLHRSHCNRRYSQWSSLRFSRFRSLSGRSRPHHHSMCKTKTAAIGSKNSKLVAVAICFSTFMRSKYSLSLCIFGGE